MPHLVGNPRSWSVFSFSPLLFSDNKVLDQNPLRYKFSTFSKSPGICKLVLDYKSECSNPWI